MKLKGKHVLIIGGAGLIGSHIVDELIKTDVGKITIYDNFTRGTLSNLEPALKDNRVEIFPLAETY